MDAKTAKLKVQEYKGYFDRFIGQNTRVRFDKHDFIVRVEDVCLARLADLENKPDKVLGEDGRYHTPHVMQIVFNDAMTFDIVLTAIKEIRPAIDNLTLVLPDIEITLSL